MGKLVVTEFVTLDGVMEDPGGSEQTRNGGWAFQFERGDEGNRFKVEELMRAEVQLLGRKTYEGFAAAWPAMNQDDFGRKMNGMAKVVVSSTLTDPTWENTTVLSGDLGSGVTELKESVEGDILVAGSRQLVQGLLELGLVDELRLMIYPVLLGSGKKLFADEGARADFEVVESGAAGECATVVLRKKN